MSRHLLLALLGLLLAACSTGPLPGLRTCDQITARGLRGLFGPQVTPDQLQRLIARITRLTLRDIHPRQDEAYWYVDWQQDGAAYTAGLIDGAVRFITIRFATVRPSAARLLACLGTPDRYQAWHDAYPGIGSQQASFIFLAQGITAYGTQQVPAGLSPPQIDGSFPIEMIGVFASGWAESEWARGNSRPWPGGWDGIVVEKVVHP